MPRPTFATLCTRTKSSKVKRAALTALAMLGTAADHAIFLTYLTDKDDNLRSAACEGLGRIKNPADLPTLEGAFKNEHKMGPRLAAAFALVRFGKSRYQRIQSAALPGEYAERYVPIREWRWRT